MTASPCFSRSQESVVRCRAGSVCTELPETCTVEDLQVGYTLVALRACIERIDGANNVFVDMLTRRSKVRRTLETQKAETVTSLYADIIYRAMKTDVGETNDFLTAQNMSNKPKNKKRLMKKYTRNLIVYGFLNTVRA